MGLFSPQILLTCACTWVVQRGDNNKSLSLHNRLSTAICASLLWSACMSHQMSICILTPTNRSLPGCDSNRRSASSTAVTEASPKALSMVKRVVSSDTRRMKSNSHVPQYQNITYTKATLGRTAMMKCTGHNLVGKKLVSRKKIHTQDKSTNQGNAFCGASSGLMSSARPRWRRTPQKTRSWGLRKRRVLGGFFCSKTSFYHLLCMYALCEHKKYCIRLCAIMDENCDLHVCAYTQRHCRGFCHREIYS